MDKTRNNVRSISWRHFPPHVENVNRSFAGIVNRVGHWIVGFVSIQKNRFPINRVLCGDHVNGSFAGYLLGDANTSR